MQAAFSVPSRKQVPGTIETFVDALICRASVQADAVFYRTVHATGTDEEVTYSQLVDAGLAIASWAKNYRIPHGSHFLLILPHSANLILAEFGSIYAGFVPSILAVPSFKMSREVYLREIRSLSNRIRPGAILTTVGIRDDLQFALEGFLCQVTTWDDVYSMERSPHLRERPNADDILLLQHSSGSTGLKKGVALTHRAVLSQVLDYAQAIDIGPEDVIASWLPLYHDMGLIAATLLPLITGTTVVGLSPFEWVMKPAMLLEAITRHRATLCWLPNFSYNFMAKRIRDEELEGIDLSSMRAFINCSEPVLAESHRIFADRFAQCGLKYSALQTCYALAECTFAATQSGDHGPSIERVDAASFTDLQIANPVADDADGIELMSSGRLLDHCEAVILDKNRKALPERHIGEITLRSPYLFDGYFRMPEVTAEVMQDGWYYTGDLGYLADGELFVTGRKKDLIIIGGKNFYPQDIERIISNDDDVIDGRVVALGLFDPELGTEGLVVLAESHVSNPEERRLVCSRLRQKLVMNLDCVARDIQLLPHMSLLKTSSGKIARHPNLEQYLSRSAPTEA